MLTLILDLKALIIRKIRQFSGGMNNDKTQSPFNLLPQCKVFFNKYLKTVKKLYRKINGLQGD
jgi:hypothetical protein